MQNGVTFSGGMSPKSPFEIKVRGIFTSDREKCETYHEVKIFHLRYRSALFTKHEQERTCLLEMDDFEEEST